MDTTTDHFPLVMTEMELIDFLRIREVSDADDPQHVIEWLKRSRGLPCFYISRKCLYFQPAVVEWVQRQNERGKP